MQSFKVGWIHFKGRQLYQIDCYPFEMEDGVYSKRKEIAPRLFRRDFVCSEATRKSPLLKMAEHLPGVLSPLNGLANCVFCHVNESQRKANRLEVQEVFNPLCSHAKYEYYNSLYMRTLGGLNTHKKSTERTGASIVTV